MQLLDHHWINKGCTVEVCYGEHRTFLVQKTYKVVCMDLSKPRTVQGLNHFIVDVYGEHLSFCESWLKLIDKPGYVRVREGEWLIK